MNEILHNCIYLTAAEFLLLAGAAGIKQMDGIFRKPVESLSDEELWGAMADLCSRGLLCPEADRAENDPEPALSGKMLTDDEEEPGSGNEEEGFFLADPDVRDLFRVIRDADLSAMFFAPGEDAPCALAYLGEQTAVLQVSGTDENAVRVFALPFPEFVAWMKAEGCLPPGMEPEDLRRRLESVAGLGIGEKRLEDFFTEGLALGVAPDGPLEKPEALPSLDTGALQSAWDDRLQEDRLEEEAVLSGSPEKRPCLFVRIRPDHPDGQPCLQITDTLWQDRDHHDAEGGEAI